VNFAESNEEGAMLAAKSGIFFSGESVAPRDQNLELGVQGVITACKAGLKQ